MSVNITVNGKFAKHRCNPLLEDAQEIKKAEDIERRILRILQVREESKKLAKRIRDEVNEEKKRELQNLQAIKEKELECWRQHTLQRKGEEYREAIFQIGTAHQAARRENEAAKQKTQTSYKNFKKQMATRKSQTSKVQFSSKTSCPCQQTQTSANKQFRCTCTQTNEPHSTKSKENASHKRRRNFSFSSSESECEDEGYKGQTTLPPTSFSFSSCSDTTSSLSLCNNRATQTSMFVPTSNKCLIKTPAVCVDVEVDTDDSITITGPAEIKDKHSEYNRQFSSVIRVSPRKGRKAMNNIIENPSMQQTSTTTTATSETVAVPEDRNKFIAIKPSDPKEKRFTLISDLVKKQQEVAAKIPINQTTTAPPVSQATSKTATPNLSPRTQLRQTTVKATMSKTQPLSPRKVSATSKSSRCFTDNTQPTTSLATTTKSNTVVPSGSSNSGRVQFYDYNSKLSKERDQAATAVNIQRQKDQTQPSAMEQAELEKQREKERQLEAMRKNQQMEERGQKALEREQVRRDCHELSEKLDALTREYPNQLPTNDNHLHLFADKQLRKEGKMNTAVEKLLQRPAIITCSELNKPQQNDTKQQTPAPTANNLNYALNVAALNNQQPLSLDDVSSDSCCSILLGYVNDQSRLVRQDLQTQNQTKQKQLKNLLKRLDELRNSLLQELKNESESKQETTKFSSNEENLRQVIDSISEMRKEREHILIKEQTKQSKPLKAREKELQAKEALLEQKVREFYELQKHQTKTVGKQDTKYQTSKDQAKEETPSSKENKEKLDNLNNDEDNKVCVTGENPLEIVITVRGETKCVKIPQQQKPKRKLLPKKSPSKLATLIRMPQTKKQTPKKKIPTAKLKDQQSVAHLKRQNSYDSNSTSYMSLPADLPNKIDDLAEGLAKERQKSEKINTPSRKDEETDKHLTSSSDNQTVSEISLEPLGETPRSNQPARVNPLIGQYVQRLLGMSRNAVQKLGVSTSDIETPSSSIINTTGNITTSHNFITDERLITIQNFMEDNRSFIKELEESIRSQNSVSLENSMRKFDDIWCKRFKKQSKKSQEQLENKQIATKEIKMPQKSSLKIKDTVNKKSSKDNKQQTVKTLPAINKQLERKSSSNNLNKDLHKTLSSHYSTDDKESLQSLKIRKDPIKKADVAIDNKLSTESSRNEPDSQIARYTKLTENCTHRIAELTELINRVRKEKQRLLEVTLSSVSDNGIQSTEYLDLAENVKSSTRHEQDDLTRVSSTSEETTKNKQSHSSDTLHEIPKLSLADKNKQITASHDSGIAESRPLTALENRNEPEPISLTSSESTMLQLTRKMKPPPTIKRFSPQFPEDDLAHELSTILEVDTPVTSRMNTAVGQSTEDRENPSENGLQQPTKFLTFEEYIKQLNLDITQLAPEQSMQLQQEFNTFLECLQLQRSPGEAPKYSEFPSISAYIQLSAENLGEKMEESLAQLHISGIHPRNFPAVREYMKRNSNKSSNEEQPFLDTESLENITENDTASLDIEEELKQRKILKNSFRYSETKTQRIFSSTAHRDAAFYQEIMTAESGIDKLSTSGNTSDLLDSDLRRGAQQQPDEKNSRKSKHVKILSSSTTSANSSALAKSALRAASLDDSDKGAGKALNIRDFITRELLKHENISGSLSTSSCDDTIRSRFFQSLIATFTPRTPGPNSKSEGLTLERQKTSTPVPMQSGQMHSTNSSHSNASSQLFSGESLLSSVHCPDRSVKVLTSDGGVNADQSSE